MKEWLLEYINCSKKELLNVKKDSMRDEIYSGKIICNGSMFFIRRRIPILLHKKLAQLLKIKGFYEAIPPIHWKASESDWIKHMRFIHLRMLFDLLRLLEGKSNFSILVIGCGWGWEIWAIRKMLSELEVRSTYKIIGVDIAYKPLKKAKKISIILHDYNTEFVVSCAEKLLFKDAIFDAVIGLFGVLDHSKFYSLIFKEIHRVLKANGLFLFTVLNKFALDWLIKVILNPRLYLKTMRKAKVPFTRVTIPLRKGGAVRVPTHYYQINELFNLLRMNGFEVVRKYGIFSLLPMNFKLRSFRRYHAILSKIEKKTFNAFPINVTGRYIGILARKTD